MSILSIRKLNSFSIWLDRIKNLSTVKYSVDHEYRNLIVRILGFSSIEKSFKDSTLSLTMNREEHEQAMIGTNTGLASEAPTLLKQATSGSTHICSLDTYIFWRRKQLDVLSSKELRVFLNGDYGTAKTFILKVIIIFLYKSEAKKC